MAENEIEKIETSELPLANSDAQPPLVVDLPDGQKLVVGNLDPGTVIEVATWRGTGRPDSRTNRIMLGVSTNEESSKPIENANTKSEELEYKPSERVKTGITYSEINNQPRNQIQPYEGRNNSKSKLSRILKPLFIVSITAAMVLIAVFPGGIRLVHPKAGANSSMGAIDSSVVIVQKNSKYQIADQVITNINIEKLSPIVAAISAAEGENYLVNSDKGYFQINKNQIRGKVLAVLPFFGYLFKIIN